MKLKTDLFPYPVLHKELDDYTESTFDVNVEELEKTPLEIKYRISFDLKDNRLSFLIQNDQACFVVHAKVNLQLIGKYLNYLKINQKLNCHLM